MVFHNHKKEVENTNADVNRIAVTPEYYDWETGKLNPLSSSGQRANADGNRMRLRVTNIRNTTWHESTMTVTVSFMRSVRGLGITQGAYGDGTVGFDANGNPAGERYFELTRKPTYVADETIAQLGYPTEAVTSKVAWNSTTPAQRLGLNNGSTAVARSHALLPASKNLTGEGVSTGRPTVVPP